MRDELSKNKKYSPLRTVQIRKLENPKGNKWKCWFKQNFTNLSREEITQCDTGSALVSSIRSANLTDQHEPAFKSVNHR